MVCLCVALVVAPACLTLSLSHMKHCVPCFKLRPGIALCPVEIGVQRICRIQETQLRTVSCMQYAAWAELVIIQLVMPNVSFVGHLCGILAGAAPARRSRPHYSTCQ